MTSTGIRAASMIGVAPTAGACGASTGTRYVALFLMFSSETNRTSNNKDLTSMEMFNYCSICASTSETSKEIQNMKDLSSSKIVHP